jgi:hypothetical protein
MGREAAMIRIGNRRQGPPCFTDDGDKPGTCNPWTPFHKLTNGRASGFQVFEPGLWLASLLGQRFGRYTSS